MWIIYSKYGKQLFATYMQKVNSLYTHTYEKRERTKQEV